MIRIERTTTGSVCLAKLSGELDIRTIAEVQDELGDAVERGCTHVVLDFSEVVYADSSCLALLVWLDRQLGPRSGKMVIAGANRDITRVLELSGLVRLAPAISTADDADEALSSIEMPQSSGELQWEREIIVPADTAELASARSRVIAMLEPLDMPEPALFDIRVAVGEALANAMRHGSPRGGSDAVSVSVQAYADRIVITVTDQGCGFDGTLTQQPDLYASSGRGVMFMRALMDQVEFAACDSGGTAVRLVKHVARARAVARDS